MIVILLLRTNQRFCIYISNIPSIARDNIRSSEVPYCHFCLTNGHVVCVPTLRYRIKSKRKTGVTRTTPNQVKNILVLLCFLTSSSVTGNGFGPRSRQIWQYLGMFWVATTVEETKRVRNLIIRGQNAAKHPTVHRRVPTATIMQQRFQAWATLIQKKQAANLLWHLCQFYPLRNSLLHSRITQVMGLESTTSNIPALHMLYVQIWVHLPSVHIQCLCNSTVL